MSTYGQPVVQRLDDEMDLREIIEMVWNGKWIIVGIVVVAALAGWFGSHFLLSTTYDASVTLLVMPTSQRSSLEPQPLALRTYQELARTNAIASSVIEQMNLTKDDGEPLLPSQLLSSFKVDIGVTSQSIEPMVGILKLNVTWSDPVEARDIANTWSQTLVDNLSELFRTEADVVADVILQQYDSMQGVLQQAETQLLQFREVSQIPLLQQKVNALWAQASQQRAYWMSLQRELDLKRHDLRTLELQLADLEENGQWVGHVVGADHLEIPERKQTVDALIQLLAAEETLRDFENGANIALMQQELSLERSTLARYQEALAQLEANKPQLETKFETLTQALAEQDPTLVLLRSISTDVLALGDIDDLAKLRLEDELLNPNYQHIKQQLIDIQIEMATTPESIQVYKTLIDHSTDKVKQLEATLRDLTKEREKLEDQLSLSSKFYELVKSQYTKLRSDHSSLVLELGRLEAEVAYVLQMLETVELDACEAEAQLLRFKLEEERLVRDLQAPKQAYESLASKVESARISQLEIMGDIRIVSDAVVPSKPSGPRHMMNLAIAILLGGMMGFGIVFIRNMFQAKKE